MTTEGEGAPLKADEPHVKKRKKTMESAEAVGPEAEPSSSSTSQKPITLEGERPQKKFYRQRAHCNPLSHNDAFAYPVRPDAMDWTVDHYPKFAGAARNQNTQPTVLDVGCGFGGLTMALGELLPNTTFVLGMEIRAKVTEYVRLRLAAARTEHDTHHNVSVLRTNSQKFLPHYFAKHSIEKLFFCFPDPHFKRKNHPRRIISDRLLAEYAHVLQTGTGLLYCITDVLELHEWHVQKLSAHPLFERVTEEELKDDPCVAAMQTRTEEGQKVSRNKGSKYHAVYRRIRDEDDAPKAALFVTAQTFFASPSQPQSQAPSDKEDK